MEQAFEAVRRITNRLERDQYVAMLWRMFEADRGLPEGHSLRGIYGAARYLLEGEEMFAGVGGAAEPTQAAVTT